MSWSSKPATRQLLRRWRIVLPVVAGIGLVLATVACGGKSQQTSSGETTPAQTSPSASTVKYCPQLVVPAYFYSAAIWTQAADSQPTPSDIILDISGEGAGDAPEAHFQAVVQQAQAAGETILGYISTVDGQRPASQVEAEVRNYRAWYGVTNIFLDRVSGEPQQLAYYQ